MKTAEEIAELYHARQRQRSPILSRLEQVRSAYNGDMVVPLPELDEDDKSGIVNLMMQGVDQLAMRVASVQPDITYPPLRPGIVLSEDKARTRRLATLGWWDMNNMAVVLRQRARYLIAYASAPVSLSPVSPKVSDKRQMPFWRSRNPLSSYLPIPDSENDMEPENAIFCSLQSRSWLEERYPDAMRRLEVAETSADDTFEVLEYTDSTEIVTCVVGKERAETGQERDIYGNVVHAGYGSPAEILDRSPNRAGIPLVVAPGRIVLDRLVGMFDQLPSLMKKQAKLDSLEYVSIKRSIFPDEWVITHPTAQSSAVVEIEATGIRGQRGEIRGGQIQSVTLAPSPLVTQAIDRLERNERVTGGLPAELGGESPTNIRTARRGAAVLSSTITMPIAEMQDIFAASLEAENVRAVALMRGWYKGKTFGFYQSRTGPKSTEKDYDVTVDFETDMNYVKYSIPGTDAAALPIEIGQRVGTTEISLQTAREMDPVVEDPIREARQVTSEALEKALLTGLEQQASQGALSPVVIAKVQQAVLGKNYPRLATAVVQIHEEMQREQATQTPTAAAAQPGMAPAGAASAAQPGGQIPPPAQTQSNLSQILQTLRRPQNLGAPERQLANA